MMYDHQFKEKKIMTERDRLEFDGVVAKSMGNGIFKVITELDAEVQCTLSGKMRQNAIRVIDGDKVRIEVTPYDPAKGRIIYRSK